MEHVYKFRKQRFLARLSQGSHQVVFVGSKALMSHLKANASREWQRRKGRLLGEGRTL